jgi:zinc transport system substrate-binding protein
MSANRTIIVAIVAVLIIGGALLMYPRLQPTEDESKTRIVASFYPLAYFAERIGGEHVQVSTIIPFNSEVHSWQPSISDIANTEDSDLIIYLGVGLDVWMEEDILETINTDEKVILEASTGIELLSDEGHEEEEEDEHEHEEGDPHLWVCPYTASQIAENVYEAIKEVDPDNTEYYTTNWNELRDTLNNLDQQYQSELATANGKKFFTTHSAYGYIAHRYNLEQRGVIGISADEQPSTAKIIEIVDAMVEENSYVIYMDPIYSTEYAETLQAELSSRTGRPVEILSLYLMLGPLDNLDYIGQLEANLDNLVRGLVG